MPETYLDSSIVGFNHQDALNARVDTYRRLAPIMNPQDAPAITAEFANNLSILSPGPSEKFSDIPEIDLGSALVSTDPTIKANALKALNAQAESTTENKYNLGRTLESPNSDYVKKFMSKDYGYSVLRDNEDFYYKNDYMKNGWFKRNVILNPGRFLARVIVPAALKIGEGLGYVGSMLTSIGSDNYWADVADNGLSSWFEGLEQGFKDQVIPVYKSAGFDEKGFFSKLTDWSFWNDAVADGVAFMASAAIPGMVLSKVGTAGAAFSVTSKLGKLASTVGLGSWQQLASWGFNTGMEAAMEASQVYKEVDKRLRAERDQGLNNLTDLDIKERAGNMAANTVAGNFAVLSISNAWENRLFFKPASEVTGRAAVSLADDFTGTSRALNQLKSGSAFDFTNPLRRGSFYGGRILSGIAMEGFWEENAQLAIQRMNQDDTEGRGFWEQLGHQTVAALSGNDPENAESIGLGGLIGAGASIGFSKLAGERKALIANTKRAVDYLNTARQSLLDANDIYARDTEGKVVYENNVPKTDPAKLLAKQKAHEQVYGKLAFANKDEYNNSRPIQFESQRALADYVKSLANIGVTDVSSKLANIKGDNAALFGLDPTKINENSAHLVSLAQGFEEHSKAVDKLDVGRRPADLSEVQFAASNKLRKTEIYRRRTDNDIMKSFITDDNSKFLAALNETRNLNNASLADFPTDQLNGMLQQRKLNQQVIDSKEFKEMSAFEQEYHVKRDIQLEKQIDKFKKDNELFLQGSTITPSGAYTPYVTLSDGSRKEVGFSKKAGQFSKDIADYTNVIHKNAFIDDLISDPDNGHDNFVKLNDTPLSRKVKDALTQPTPIQKKYTELQKGDFDKVTKLVAKMVFGENQVFSPEELQLQSNYKDLINELLPQYENAVETQRTKLLQGRLNTLRSQQQALSKIVSENREKAGFKKLEIDELADDLRTLTELGAKKPDLNRIKASMEILTKDLQVLDTTLQEQEERLNSLNEEAAVLEQEVNAGDFKGLSNALAELKREVDWVDNELKTSRTLLEKAIKVLRDILRTVKALFPNFDFKSLDRIFSDPIYGAANKEAYSDTGLVEPYTEIRNKKDEIERLKALIPELEQTKLELLNKYKNNKAEIISILDAANKEFRDRYIEVTKVAPSAKPDPTEDAITKGLTADTGAFPKGVNSEGQQPNEEEGFDGDTYQRPLATKFFTSTFPFITDLSAQPQDVQDYFAFVNLLSDPTNKDVITKKLGKGELQVLTVTKNNVESLKLGKVLSERKQFFAIDDPALTHVEVIPVLEDAGYLYYVDKDMNKLEKVGEEPSNKIVRRSLRTVKFTPEEQAQYEQKYGQKEMDKAAKAATDWRKELLQQTKDTPDKTFDFFITRGIPNKMKMQDGQQALNPVVDTLVPEKSITGTTVRVYSVDHPTQELNGETVTLPAGRPFIYTTNGIHEQLHAANNSKLSPEQVELVTTVFEELLTDHLKKATEAIEKSKSFPKNLKEAITKAGGIQNLDPATKKQVYFKLTSTDDTRKNLLNSNYTNFLSSIIYFGPRQKDKTGGKNQVYLKGYMLVFGDTNTFIDITDPTSIRTDPDAQAFLSRQFHNIKYFPNEAKANRPYVEYYLDGKKLASRQWKTYSHYLISEKNPDGSARKSIPITTSIKTKAQHDLEKGSNPYYPYISRGISIVTEAVPTVKKVTTPVDKGTKPGSLQDILKAKRGEKTEAKVPTKKPTSLKEILEAKRSGKTVIPENEETKLEGKKTTLAEAVARMKERQKKAEEPNDQEVPDYGPKEKPVVTPSKLPGSDNFRVATSGLFKTEEDLNAVLADIKRMIPQFPIQRLEKAIRVTDDIQAWGQFIDSIIKVFEGAEEGTGYHEAFEALVNRILSDPEWNAMYKEFKARSGYFTDRETGDRVRYTDATAHQAKEELAEEFRRYKLGQQPQQPQTRSYFRIIWDFIKSFFQGRSKIEDVFAQLDEGKFAQRVTRAQDRFANNYRLFPELPVQVKRDLYEGATSLMFQQVFNTPASLSALDEIDETDESIYEPIKSQFIEIVRFLESQSLIEKDEQLKNNYKKSASYINHVLADWKTFVEGHKKDIKRFRIRFEEQENLEQKEELNDTTNRNDYVNDAFKTDGRRSASKSIRFLLGTLLQFNFAQDGSTRTVNGRTLGTIITKPNSVFMNTLVNQDSFMLKVLEQFQGLSNFTQVEEKLAELAGINEIEAIENPEAQRKFIAEMNSERATWTSLYMRLFGFSNSVSEEAALNLKVKFHNYVSKHTPEPYLYVYGGGTSAIISSVRRGFTESITRKVESSIVTNAHLVFQKKNRDGLRVFVPIKAFRSPTTIEAFADSKEFSKSKAATFVKFLGLDDTITPEFVTGLSIPERKRLFNILLTIRNALTKANTPTLSIKQLDIFGYTQNLINFIDARTTVAQKDAQFQNIENQSQQRHIVPSYVSRILSEINNVGSREELEERFPQLASQFASSSILLSKLFDEAGNRTNFQISLGYMEGVKDMEEDEGTKAARLEFTDKYYLQFNASLSGLYYSLPADSETEWLFNFGEFVPFSENLLEERGNDIVNEVFLPKLKSEIDAALVNPRNLLQFRGKHDSFPEVEIGSALRFFKDILQYTGKGKTDKALVKEIHQLILKGTPSEKIVMDKKLLPRIRKAILSYLAVESQKTLDTMKDNRLLLDTENGYYMTGLNSSLIDKYPQSFTMDRGAVRMSDNQAKALVQYQKVNTIIANMESFQLVFGDPAQYKDWEKRAKSMFGPIEQVYHDSDGQLDNWLNENKNSAVLGEEIVELGDEDMHRTLFSNEVYSRTVDDFAVVDTDTVNDLYAADSDFARKFLEKYEDINETDGQSIGTLAYARHLLIKSGWRWTKEHEAYWQYDSALMRSELSGQGKYTYEDPKLRALDTKIINFYQENPITVYLSPVKTLMPFQLPNGEQVLLKHSVHFMSYQVAKDFEMLDRYIDMLKNNESLLNFRSTQKVGLEVDDNGKITPYYEDPFTKNNLDVAGNPVQTIDLRTVGIQVETQNTGKGQTLGSQVTKLSNLNMSETGVPTDYEVPNSTESEKISTWNALSEEEKLAASEKYRLVKGEAGTITSLENMKIKNTMDKFSELGVKWNYKDGEITYNIKDLTKIKDYIDNELRRLEVEDNVVDNIQLTNDLKAFVNPAETLPSYTTISNLLWSLADKAVTSMKVNGKPFIQVSSAFFNKGSRKAAYFEDGKWHRVNTKQEYDQAVEDGKKLVMTSSELKFYTKDSETGAINAMEVYLPHIYKQKINDKRKLAGLPALSDEAIMATLQRDHRLLEGIGFRIPTQATSSMDFFTIKGFLPEAFGTAIVVPSAITVKSGSDFDVDKLNTYLNNFKLDKEGLPYYEEFRDDSNSTPADRYIRFIKSQYREYSAVRNEMRASLEYAGTLDLIEQNERAVQGAKEVIGEAKQDEESTYQVGFEIFRGLPLALKQQYFEAERGLRAQEIGGQEKILEYLAYTKDWIRQFESTGALKLEITQTILNQVVKGVEIINSRDVTPALKNMVENYQEVLGKMGITKEMIDEYLAIKDQKLDENSTARKNFELRLANIIAEFNELPTYNEFKGLPLFLQNTKGALENRYFASIRAILKQPDMFEYLLSPNSVDHIKQNRDYVFDALGKESEEKQELDYTRFLSTEYIAEKRNHFTKGKYDIGIFAVAMTNFANSQITGIGITAEGGVKSSDSYVFDDLNESEVFLPFEDIETLKVDGKFFLSISRLRDKTGTLTMDKLSAYINGAVDVAREPAIVEMGMHTELAGVYTLMERMGLTGKTTALFLYQPVVREWLRELLFLNSKSYFGHSSYRFPKEITQDLVDTYKPEKFVYDPAYKFTDAQLTSLIKKGEKVKKGEGEFTASEKEAQYYTLTAFLKMRMMSQHLLESIQASNHDTASIRSPYILMRKDLQLERSKEGNVITKVIKGEVKNGSQALRDETSVGTDIDMMKKFSDLFSKIGLFALQKQNPRDTLYTIAKRIYRQDPFMTADDFVKAMREYEAAMVDSLANKILIGAKVGNDIVYNPLYKYASKFFRTASAGSIRNEYLALKAIYPNTFKNNFFLKNLEINTNQELGIDTLELKLKPGNSEVLTKELLTEGMLELASFDERKWPALVAFYRSIVYGAYLQFGIKFSRKSFVDLIPVSKVTDQHNVLSINSITKPALDKINQEDFSTLDEQVQRSKWHKKGIVPQRTQMTVHFLSPRKKANSEDIEYVLEPKETWRDGKSKPPNKTSQIFFGRQVTIQEEGEEVNLMVPHIHPIMVWNGYRGTNTKWVDAPNIISIPAIKPEYITLREVSTPSGNVVTSYTVSRRVYDMMKKGDHSYMFYQLFKKVGAENPSFGRGMITKGKKDKENVLYLYKPINKYGSRDFNEIKPLVVTDQDTVTGERSILNFPEFKEIEDSELISRINNDKNKLLPVAQTSVPIAGINEFIMPIHAKDLEDLPPIEPEC